MVEPARFALTSTPSIGPSSFELTCPVRALVRPDWAWPATLTTRRRTKNPIRIWPPPGESTSALPHPVTFRAQADRELDLHVACAVGTACEGDEVRRELLGQL